MTDSTSIPSNVSGGLALRSCRLLTFAVVCLISLLTACRQTLELPITARYGPHPVLPAPEESLIPVIDIAPAVGWPLGSAPRAAPDLAVNPFATGLDHPRWLYVLPNGDVLVAESNAPPQPDNKGGIRAWITQKVMERAGAAVPSADRITLLRDSDGDGEADFRTAFLEDLHSPFGMVLLGDNLIVANTDALVRFPYIAGATAITAPGEKITSLPAGPINHHWTKNVVVHRGHGQLLATVGSNSNIAENGMQAEESRAAILAIDPISGRTRIYASGLRNPNGLAWQPQTGALWTVVNERDGLGNNLVPDYLTSVVDGGFYGWPYSYYGQHVDTRVTPQDPELVARAIVPEYALGAHTAALGLAFYDAELLPERYRGGAFVGLHGSWNRRPPSGYKVIFVPFEDGRPNGMPRDVLTGFLSDDGDAFGRPVGIAVDRSGALLVADDVGNTVWRVTPATSTVGRSSAPPPEDE
jgi:glucose/arabinose dehydrogenase